MKFLLPITFVTCLLLSACATTAPIPLAAELQHHWQLTGMDGAPVKTTLDSEITFGSDLKVSGRAGCNQFFGHAELHQTTLTAQPLGVTMMACAPAAQKIESAVLDTLNHGATASVRGNQLRLVGRDHDLVYSRMP
ncbi:MAG TPA: META domain-containing protein [Nevskiaceae bacterium]|nr:META domain-containing protein [Nevskiaceae bacterium]